MIKYRIIGDLFYGKRKEISTQSTNDGGKMKHHSPAWAIPVPISGD